VSSFLHAIPMLDRKRCCELVPTVAIRSDIGQEQQSLLKQMRQESVYALGSAIQTGFIIC
jgi:hypothetical protein